MTAARVLASFAALAFVAVAACAGEPDTEMADTGMASAMAQAPDTTAEAMWAHLQAEQYRDRWRLWPGKDRLYTGQEPHGMLLTTYVNEVAHGALANGETRMPTGAIIVKENYMPDSTFAAATVMYKVAGYDAANADWFWMKRNADGSVDGAGRMDGCVQCHGAQRNNDFIFTAVPGR